jgi:hypothetical protein
LGEVLRRSATKKKKTVRLTKNIHWGMIYRRSSTGLVRG